MYKRFLIIDSGGDGRLVSRWPHRLRVNEVAFRVNIQIPDGWAKIQDGTINLMMPEPPTEAALEILAAK